MMGCATGPCTHPLGPTRCPVCRWLSVGRHTPEDDTRRRRNPTRDGTPRLSGERARAGTTSTRRRPVPAIQKTTATR